MDTSQAVRYCSECGRQVTDDDLARFGERWVCAWCKPAFVQRLREGAPQSGQKEFAGFWIRAAAYLIDGLLLGAVAFALQIVFALAMPALVLPMKNGSPAHFGLFLAVFALLALLNMAIACCYETFFVARFSATPGKMALRLKVAMPDGRPVSAPRACGRYFAKALSGMVLGIGFVMAGLDNEKRGLHDFLCNTRVVKA